MLPPTITLNATKHLMRQRNLSVTHMVAVTGIPKPRFLILYSENKEIIEEPWLDEAAAIAGALGFVGINALSLSGNLTLIEQPFDVRDPVDVWRTGKRLTLGFACRLAARFGFNDPIEIFNITAMDPSTRQRLEMLATGERTSGICPWCQTSTVGSPGETPDHNPSCWFGVLYGPRDAPLATIGAAPVPGRPGKRRGGSRPAPGLLPLRLARGTTQEQMAASIEIHPVTYNRLETCKNPLTHELAEKIATLYKVPIVDLYSVDGHIPAPVVPPTPVPRLPVPGKLTVFT